MGTTSITLVSSTGSNVITLDDLIANGINVGISENLSVTGSSYFKNAQVQVDGYLKANAGISGSLTKLTDGTSYLIAGSNIAITTGSSGAVTISSTATGGGSSAAIAYNGYCTGSLAWQSAFQWTDFRLAPGNFTDTLQMGITRSGSTFTVSEAGTYFFRSDFNHQNLNMYTAFRISGSSGTIIQQTVYSGLSNFGPVEGDGADLTGIFTLSAGESFKLQYTTKSLAGAYGTWSPTDPIDGEKMRSGVITIFRIGVS